MQQTQTARAFRLIEASMILLFFLTGARTVVAVMLGLVTGALAGGQIDINFINVHLLTAGAIAVVWFSPRPRTTLPTTLSLSALVVAIARVPMTVAQPTVRLYAALIVFAAGGFYIASLIRANYRTWLSGLIIALALDQLSRAAGYTYDVSLRASWLIPQLVISSVAIWVSRVARGRAKSEPYEPANLSLWNGLSLGAFLFLEMAVLGMPNVIARWASVDYRLVVGWLVLATGLTLSPNVRQYLARPLEMFDERSRGWVWMLLLALLIVLGNRTGGPVAAVVLILAQVVGLMMLWWIPDALNREELEQVGPALTFALAFYVILSYLYLLIFEDSRVFLPLSGQALTLHLVAVVVLSVVLIGWRDPDPWHSRVVSPQRGLPLAFAVLTFVATLVGVRPLPELELPDTGTLRVASYDIHYGYSPEWRYDLELTAQFVEASGADVVALQRVDVGRQASYGVDQVAWLARRLRMNHFYSPTIEQLTGLAILSKWPIEQEGGVLLASQNEQMGVAFAVVRREPGTRGVNVYSTRLAAGDEERLTQVGGLLGFIGNANTVVVAGNMQLIPGGDPYTQLTVGNLTDPNAALNIVQDFTYPASNPNQRLDYIFLRGLSSIESQKVCGPVPASDHCLIVIETLRP